MKVSKKIILSLSVFGIISCSNGQKEKEHGHSHGPNGEHLEGDNHDQHEEHHQETFEIQTDSTKTDSLNEQGTKPSDHHTHKDGTSHSH